VEKRYDRLSELRDELASFNALGQITMPGAPRREEIMAALVLRLGAVFALIEELEVDPIITVLL
jgi:hypothetical protein